MHLRKCHKSESVTHSVMSDSLRPNELQPARLLCPWNSPGKNSGLGSHSLLQGIFPRSLKLKGLNPSLPNCRWILYHLSHQEALSISYQSGKLKIMYGKELKREKIKKYKELLFKAQTPDFLRVVTKEPLYYFLRFFGHSANMHFPTTP